MWWQANLDQLSVAPLSCYGEAVVGGVQQHAPAQQGV